MIRLATIIFALCIAGAALAQQISPTAFASIRFEP
jgi:hypothetical protein